MTIWEPATDHGITFWMDEQEIGLLSLQLQLEITAGVRYNKDVCGRGYALSFDKCSVGLLH